MPSQTTPSTEPTYHRIARKGKLAETVAESVKQDIIAMGWPVGTVLGNEPQLQERYGVSRATMREAIRQLERHGVARMRRGTNGGLIIQEPAKVSAVLALAAYLELTQISFDELFEAREVIEGMAMEQAAERFPDEEVPRARDLIHELERDPLPAFAEEMALHSRVRHFLGDITRNPATSLILDALHQVLMHLGSPKVRGPRRKRLQREARETRIRILESLIEGDATGAREAMGELVGISKALIGRQPVSASDNSEPRLSHMQASTGGPVHEIYEKTAHRLALIIASGIGEAGLQPGDRLGTEHELQQHYNVSRAVLRETLRILELHAILVSKRGYGGGLIVSEPDPEYTISIVISYLQYYNFGRHFFYEVWKTVLLAATRFACERIDQEGRARLQYYLEQAQHAPPESYLESAHALEVAMSDSSGNRALSLFARVLTDMAGSYPAESPPPEVVEKLSTEHKKIVTAILIGESGVARRAMIRYLNYISAWFGPDVRKSWLDRVKEKKQRRSS